MLRERSCFQHAENGLLRLFRVFAADISAGATGMLALGPFRFLDDNERGSLMTPLSAARIASIPDAGRHVALSAAAKAGSAHTRRSYETSMRMFAAWYALTYGHPLALPVDPAAVAQFIADYAEGGVEAKRSDSFERVDAALVAGGFKAAVGPMRFSTMKQRLAGLCAFHAERGFQNPVAHPTVQVLLKSARKQARLAGRLLPGKKRPILKDDLLALSASLGGDVVSVRDRAIILFGWATGGRRRSEIAAATFENLEAAGADHPNEFTYRLTGTKAQGDYDVDLVPLRGPAAIAMREWMAALASQGLSCTGPIFRRIAGRRISDAGITGQQVARVVQKRGHLLGLENLGGHSLRSGYITSAVRAGVPLAEIQKMTTHRAVQSVVGYVQLDPHTNQGADLLASPDTSETS